MKKLMVKPVYYEKVKEVQQRPNENPAVFQERLEETFRKYTNEDPLPPRDRPFVLLATHFIVQSAPDIRHKIQKVIAGPQTPMNDLLQLAYSVFNNMDAAKKADAWRETNKRLKWLQRLCPLRDQRRGRVFWANLTMVGHKAHGHPNKITVLCVDRRDAGGKILINGPFANSQCLGRGDTSDASGRSGGH